MRWLLSTLLLICMLFRSFTAETESKCVRGKYPPPSKNKVPLYTIDLDLPAEYRWMKLVSEKKDKIVYLISSFKKILIELAGSLGQKLLNFVDNNVGEIIDSFPEPFPGELRGIAKASGIPLGEVVIYNIFYEIFTVCTSIVAQDKTGRLYHARNLDFGLFMGWDAKNHTWAITEALRPIIVNLEFIKNNRTVFKSTNYAGYVGILTAIKPGVFTLTMNERFNVDGGYLGIISWFLGNHTSHWMGFLTRQVLENSMSYDDAKQQLTTLPLLAPAYYILGGNTSQQACVITRSREKAVDVWDITSTNHSWYILETNYDHWEAPLFLDDRRTPANNCMNKLTQEGVSFAGLYNVLSSKPVLNKLTTYTALMQVNSGQLETYLQDCPDPCFPW